MSVRYERKLLAMFWTGAVLVFFAGVVMWFAPRLWPLAAVLACCGAVLSWLGWRVQWSSSC